MSRLKRPVLVLNASFEPVHVCSTRRALLLVWRGAARVEEAGTGAIRTPRTSFEVPSVIRLVEYHRIPRPRPTATRRNILQRDGHRCQYCGQRQTAAVLTLDHVVPRSRGGANTWENLVAACQPCNLRKGGRTPEEARMPLLRPARAYACRRAPIPRGEDERWAKYVFA